MRAAVHSTNDLQVPANDPTVAALMDCADACYGSLGYSQENSSNQRDALMFAAARCATVLRALDGGLDPRLVACLDQCRLCAAEIHEFLGLPAPALSLAV